MQQTETAISNSGTARYIERLQRGEVPPPPIASTLGLVLVSAEPGEAVSQMVVKPQRHANPMGTVHGGVLVSLADLAMGAAYGGTLQDGESFTTLEISTNFLRPVWSGTLTATARVVHGGRNIGVVGCDVTDEKGRLVARAKSTCMTLRGEQASGR
jgi:uncharacterized protein (TIGR00369 family)